MPADNLPAMPRQRQRVVAQHAADTWVLLDVDSGRYYAVAQVGGRIWDLCDGTRTVAQIADVVQDEFDVAGDVARQDVAAFVEALCGESLLT